MRKSVLSTMLLFGVCLMLVTFGSYANSEVTYTMIDLGTLGGNSSCPYAINERGQVVGVSTTPEGNYHGFLWDSVNGMQDLGTLGGNTTYAYDINDSGQVVGYSDLSNGSRHAFIWENGVMTDLGSGCARGINNLGQVTGTSWSVNEAFIWDEVNGMQYLGTLGGEESRGIDINNYGQVVGTSFNASGYLQAFLWNSINGMQALAMPQGYQSSVAFSINEGGQVVGHASTVSEPHPHHAFLWDSINVMQELGTLGGDQREAYAINDFGVVVGESSIPGLAYAHGFIWDSATGMQDLNDLIIPADGVEFVRGTCDINNAGQIVGSGRINGTWHAVLLMSVPENQPPVANAGPDQTIAAGPNCMAAVTLDGSGSSDPDNDPLTYTWTWDGGEASGEIPTIQLPLGIHTITLVVNDGTVDSELDTVDITAIDDTPPEISISVSPDTLWPPNHKMVLITPTITASDNCDPNPVIVLTSITMNEGEETNTYDPNFDSTVGDGNTVSDIQVDDNGNIYLRAERSGTGSGRIYTITYTATDASGNSASASAIVTVPHDQR